MNLVQTILNAQNGAIVSQLAAGMGLDERQARSAVEALAPALGRGIGRNAGSPQGMDALLGALSRGNHSAYIDQPERLTRPDAVDEGNGILGHIFGSKDVSREVAAQAADRSGVDSDILKRMLPLLASAAMGAVAKQGFGTTAAPDAGRATGQTGDLGSMLSGFLDADKDGSVIDDVLGMASRFLR